MVTRKANSRVYWADRETQDRNVFGEIEGVIAREQNVIAKEKKIYAAARADLDREMKTLLDDVGEEAVTQAILQKPLTAKELEDWSHRQQNRLDELIAQFGEKEGRKKYGLEIAATGKQSRANRVVRRVTALKNSIDLIADASAEKVESVTSEALHKEVQKGAESFSNQISTGLDVDFNANSEKTTTRVAQTVFKAEDFSDRIWANRDVLVDDLNRSIGLAVTNGWSIDRLSKEFEHNVAVNERSSERISRTEINRISNQTELVYYQENKIKYYRFVATEDARTCEICGKLHDQIFAVDSAETGSNFPPVHPNCRCRTVISTVDENGMADDSWLDDMQKEIDAILNEDDQNDSEVKDIADIAPTVEKWTKKDAIERINDLREYATPETMGDEVVHVWTKDGKYYRMAEDGFDDFKIKDIAAAVGDNGETFQVFKSRDLSKEIEQEIIELTQPEQGDHDLKQNDKEKDEINKNLIKDEAKRLFDKTYEFKDENGNVIWSANAEEFCFNLFEALQVAGNEKSRSALVKEYMKIRKDMEQFIKDYVIKLGIYKTDESTYYHFTTKDLKTIGIPAKLANIIKECDYWLAQIKDSDMEETAKKFNEQKRNNVINDEHYKLINELLDIESSQKNDEIPNGTILAMANRDFSGREDLNDLYPENDNHTKCFTHNEVNDLENRLKKANKDIEITPENLPATMLYVDGGYRMLNALNRSPQSVQYQLDYYNYRHIEHTISRLDLERYSDLLSKEIQKFTLPESVTVKRLLNNASFLTGGLTNEKTLKSLVGSTIKDKGFVSTSINLNYDGTFGGRSNDKVVMYIDIPAGAHAAYIAGIGGIFPWQKELILDKGTEFRIINAGERIAGSRNGEHVVEFFIHAKALL